MHRRSNTLKAICSLLVVMTASCKPSYEDKLTPGIFLEPMSRPALPAGMTLRAVSDKGLQLTKLSEGFVPTLYDDAAGYCTIAYGHLIAKRSCDGNEPKEFLSGVSEPRGSELLVEDMQFAQYIVMAAVSDPSALTGGQYSALCDFVFNVGGANFRSSTLLKRINEGKLDQVPTEFRRWVLANGVRYGGLVTRREREIELFFDGLPKPRAAPPADSVKVLDIRQPES